MFKLLAASLAISLGLSAGALADDNSIAAKFAGKSLSGNNLVLNIKSDGTFNGKVGKNLEQDLVGTWKISNGRWCRTITEPDRFKGSECQKLTFNGDGTVTIGGKNGPAKYTLK